MAGSTAGCRRSSDCRWRWPDGWRDGCRDPKGAWGRVLLSLPLCTGAAACRCAWQLGARVVAVIWEAIGADDDTTPSKCNGRSRVERIREPHSHSCRSTGTARPAARSIGAVQLFLLFNMRIIVAPGGAPCERLHNASREGPVELRLQPCRGRPGAPRKRGSMVVMGATGDQSADGSCTRAHQSAQRRRWHQHRPRPPQADARRCLLQASRRSRRRAWVLAYCPQC